MNKAAIVARVARRMGLNKFAAEGAVDTVLEAIAEGLAKEEDVRIAGFWHLQDAEPGLQGRAATRRRARACGYRRRRYRRSRRQ